MNERTTMLAGFRDAFIEIPEAPVYVQPKRYCAKEMCGKRLTYLNPEDTCYACQDAIRQQRLRRVSWTDETVGRLDIAPRSKSRFM